MPRSMFRLPGGTASDTILAVAVAAVSLALELIYAAIGDDSLRAGAFLLLLTGAAGLALLRRAPTLAGLVIGLSVPLYYLVGAVDTWAPVLTFGIGIFRLASEGFRLAAIIGTAVTLALLTAGEVGTVLTGGALSERTFYGLAWPLVILVGGEAMRNRREYLREARQRAAEAEHTREEEAQRRATEERLRIARELHDVLAHRISLINVQASAAAHRQDADQAFAALTEIKAASKETLRELRATLGVLRQVDDPEAGASGTDAAPLSPAPSLQRLEALAAEFTQAGLPIELTVTGDIEHVPSAVDLAAYRIVQEALTNSLRHAGPATAEVSVEHTPGEVRLRIVDDGTGTTGETRGHGLAGMTERATALGGELETRPPTAGGFAVHARIPYPAD